MNFTEILKNRRSIRNYQEKPVPTDLIKSIINDSTLAPSAGNQQPWEFIIVNKREMINQISEECKKNFLERIAVNPHDYAKRYESMLRKEGFNIFYNAPAVVFLLGEAGLKNLYVDCALAASYLMMSAASKGLGTCWVNFGIAIRDTKLRAELGLKDNHCIVAPIAVGYPSKIPGVPHRVEPQILNVIN